MKEICFLLFSILFLGQGFAQECKKNHLHLEGIPDFKNYFENSKFYECAEQELVDPLMDTWRLQDFVLHECQKKNRVHPVFEK